MRGDHGERQMKRIMLASVALAGVSCSGTGPKDLPNIEDLNLDVQIDGFADLEDAQDDVESYDVNMCVAAGGRIYVVWRDDREGSTSDVWFNMSGDAGLTWLPAPRRIKQGTGDATGVHMTCSGPRVYAVWEDDRDGETGYENIYLNFTGDEGDSWQDDDIPIDADPDGYAISLGPRVALHEGQVHVVWYDQIEGAPDVYVATSANGGRRFADPVRVSGNREDDGAGEAWSGNPEMSVNDAGRVHVAWEDTRNGKQDIFFAGRNDGVVEFEPQKRVDTGDTRGSNYSFAPRIASDGDHVYVVWHDGRAGLHRDIYMNYSADGGETWLESAERVESDAMGFSESLNPDLVVEGDTAYIVWQDARNVGYDIYYRRIVAGNPATADEEVRLDVSDTPGAGNSVQPKIVKRDSVIAVLWMDHREDAGEGYNDLYYNWIDLAAEEPAWDEDHRVDSIGAGTSYTEQHQLDIQDGYLFASWIDGRSGTRDIYFSRVELGQAVDSRELLAEILAAQGGTAAP